jgi:hypothetical protein
MSGFVLAFLMEHTHYSPQHLSTVGSAIGSVFRQLHPGKEMIANTGAFLQQKEGQQ